MEELSWRQTAKALISQAFPYRWGIVALFVVTTIPNVLTLLVPFIGKWLVDAISASASPSWEAVHLPFLVFSGTLAVIWVLYRASSTIGAYIEVPMMGRAKSVIYERLVRQPASFFSDEASGKLVHQVESFGSVLQEALNMALYEFVPTVAYIVIFAFALGQHSLWWVAAFMVWLGLLFCVQYYLARQIEQVRRKEREARTEASGRLADAVGNTMTAKVFGREADEAHGVRVKFALASQASTRSILKEEWLWGLQNALLLLIEIVFMYAVLRAWAMGQASVGDVVLVQGYIGLMFNYLQRFTRIFRRVPRWFSDAAPAARWLLQEPAIMDAPNARTLRVQRGEIRFDQATFAYHDGRDVLRRFSLTIQPGEKVALVGLSGAGKSTVFKILERFYDPQTGRVLIDGQDVSLVTQESLHRSIALVPQDPVLFHRSILENIRYANPRASRVVVEKAAKLAHAHEFIRRLPDGYDSLVGDRGVKLSGGERQRVAIARAVVADAPILLLDEATSSLDSESEALIKDALHKVMRGKTVLVIAHRLSTIMEMDRIVVMEKGKIVAQGTHQELLAQNGTYAKLWKLQSGGYLQE